MWTHTYPTGKVTPRATVMSSSSSTFGAGVQRSARPPGYLPSEALWLASNQNLSSWPTPSHGWGSGETEAGRNITELSIFSAAHTVWCQK